MKGSFYILTANILSMPIFKYLFSADVPPQSIAVLHTIFAAVMFWSTPIFIPKEKVCKRDKMILFACGLCGVKFNQSLFVYGLKMTSLTDISVSASATPILVLLLTAIILHEPIYPS